MRHLVIVLAVALVVTPACKKNDNTRIVVAVSSNLAVPARLDTVRIDVMGKSKTSDSFRLATPDASAKTPFPVVLELVPLGDKSEAFTVTAVGLLAGNPVVAQSAYVAFVSGQALLLKLSLDDACAGVSCVDPSVTCAGGTCGRPVAVGPLPPYVEKDLYATDAATPVLDAGAQDVATPDTQVLDAIQDVPLPGDATRKCRFGESQFGLCSFGP